MKTKIFPLLLACCIVALTLPNSGARVVQAQTSEEAFQQEFEAYAATHTQEELVAYAQQRVLQIAQSELEPEPNVPIPLESDDIPSCIRARKEACRRGYNGEIFSNAAVGVGILAGCAVGTAGTGTIFCVVFVVVGQQFANAGSRERHGQCEITAVQDCFDKQDVR